MHRKQASRDIELREQEIGLLNSEGKTTYAHETEMDRHSVSRESRGLAEEMAYFDLQNDRDQDVLKQVSDLSSQLVTLATGPAGAAIAMQTLRRFGRFLIPSFMQGPEACAQIRPKKMHPTAHLDGLRGLAAFAVFFCHLYLQSYTIFFGWGKGGKNHNFLRLPFVRLLYNGPASVDVFFVISGYALSYRPLRLLRAGNFHDLGITMCSLTFRRAIRLYLPCIVSTFMIVLMVRMGLYDLTKEFANSPAYMPGSRPHHPERLRTMSAQLVDWGNKMWNFFHIFGWDKPAARVDYDIHLWTIPVEFRCSLYLFLVILATARLRTLWRYTVVAGMMYVSFRHNRWELVLFLLGMAIAEFDHIQGLHVGNIPKQPQGAVRYFWIVCSIVALYLLSVPAAAASTPGWKSLARLIPKWMEEKGEFWRMWGSALFVLSIGRLPGYQAFFNSFPVQYLGKLSYALYLMHGPVIHVIGYHIEKWALDLSGLKGGNYNIGFNLAALIMTPILLLCSDWFWRAVDIPIVKFGKWFENQLIAKHD